MSAYSEWKYGLISEAEYNSICRAEEYYERFNDETQWDVEEDEDDVDE